MREHDVVVRVEVASDILEGEPAHLDEAEERFRAQQAVFFGLRMCQSAAIRNGTGSKSPGALMELGVGSCAKHTLMPAARRVSMRSSGGCSMWLMLQAIPIGAGEAGSEQWKVKEAGEDDWGILVMGLRDKLGRFEGRNSVGYRGVWGSRPELVLFSLGEDFGAVLDDLMNESAWNLVRASVLLGADATFPVTWSR